MTTHPHLEGLTRKWREHEHAGDSAWGAGYMAAMKDCADDLAKALAALPGGGVDDAMVDRAMSCRPFQSADFAPSESPACDYLPMPKHDARKFIRAVLIAALPTPNPHEADRNGRGDE